MRLIETAAGATQRKIHYAVNASGGLVPSVASASAGTVGDTAYVDIFKDLSLANHRLYRQGRVPMVRIGFIGPFGGNVTNAAVLCQALPNTWQVRKAHQFALKQYLRATRETRRATGQARWHDFKTYMEDGMRTGNHVLTPLGVTAGSSEWNYSEVANDPSNGSSNERQFKFIGSTDSNCWGMISEYDVKADTDTDTPENPGSYAPYHYLNPEVSGEQMDNLLDEGDFPPYNPDALQVQLRAEVIAQGFGKSDRLVSGWFPAPCGLLKLQSQVTTASDNVADDGDGLFFVEVLSGDYKGVHATPMGLKL